MSKPNNQERAIMATKTMATRAVTTVEGEFLPKKKKISKRSESAKSESAKQRTEEMQKAVNLGVGIGFGLVMGAMLAVRTLNQGK